MDNEKDKIKSDKFCIGIFSVLGGYNQTYCEGVTVQLKQTKDIATVVELNFKTKMLMVVFGPEDLDHPHEIRFEDVNPYEMNKSIHYPDFFHREVIKNVFSYIYIYYN